MVKPQVNTLFEISWEVCNKVGGIYSVITSKAEYMQEAYNSYHAIGPYQNQKKDEFIPQPIPTSWEEAIERLQKEGIVVHYGTWNTKSNPNVILLEYTGIQDKVDTLKADLWDYYGVDTLNSGGDVNNPILLSYAASRFLQELKKDNCVGHRTVLHAHEWLTGFTTLFIDQWNVPIHTVFTTHATMLGRTISGKEGNLYETLQSINPDEKAHQLGVQDKHTAERAAAQTANVFTTVSDVTRKECEALLGRNPDVLVLNGIDVRHFPHFEEASVRHREHNKKINEFLSYTFYPHYTFDTDKNLTYLFAGRYEYENKGLDILLESLKDLDKELQGTDKTVTALLCIAMPNNGPKYSLLQQKIGYQHIQDQLQTHGDNLLDNILFDLLTNKNKTERELMQSDEFRSLHKSLTRFKKENTSPVLCTHRVNEDNKVIRKMKELGLTNKEGNNVKVLLCPAYLDGNDGLLNLSYFEMISASDLGIYPSYYEPWGYTPIETASMGVPTVTTDLAGFGKYIEKESETVPGEGGIHVVPRYKKTHEDVVKALTNTLLTYTKKTEKERVKEKIRAKELSERPDWEQFKDNYIEAHNLSL